LLNRSLLATLTALLVAASLNGLGAVPTGRTEPLGSIAARGPVWLNQPSGRESAGVPAGTALFIGDVVQTGESGGALLRLLSGASASVAENSNVALISDSASEGGPGGAGGIAALDLRRGVLVVLNSGQQPARVSVRGASVILRGRPGFPAACRVAAIGQSAAVFADRGLVEVHGPGRSLILAPGEHLRLVDGAVGGPDSTIAGKVTDSLPYEQVLHPGESVEVPLKLGELVSVDDAIRTLQTGRVRIQLLDGSFVNLGTLSKLQVTKHDPSTQQTEIDLKWGHLRGEIGKANASIRVRTATAAVDAAGAIFVVGADGKHTRACAVKGLVAVRNADPAVSGAVRLNEGECTTVALGREPHSPKASSLLRYEMRRTEVPGNSVAAALGQPGSVIVPHVERAREIRVAATATDGVAAGLAVAGFVLVEDTKSSLDDARSHLSQATNQAGTAASDGNAALAAAQAASATATSVCEAFQQFQHEASPSAPTVPCP
jgi:FecR-like protein